MIYKNQYLDSGCQHKNYFVGKVVQRQSSEAMIQPNIKSRSQAYCHYIDNGNIFLRQNMTKIAPLQSFVVKITPVNFTSVRRQS
jgi:hypothetical protein